MGRTGTLVSAFRVSRADARRAAASLLEAEGASDALSYQDSLQFIRQGLIDNPDTLRFPPSSPRVPEKGDSKSRGKH